MHRCFRNVYSQSTQEENPTETQLFGPCPIQTPDNRQWKGQEDKVHYDIEDLVDNEEGIPVKAFRRHALVPVTLQRPALQSASQEDGSSPQSNEIDYAVRYAHKCPRGEESSVEKDDGYSEEGTQDKVGELVGEKDL